MSQDRGNVNRTQKKKSSIIKDFFFMRMAGLEPAHCHQRQILSLMRLPVPPQPQNQLLDYNNIPLREMQAVFSIFLNIFFVQPKCMIESRFSVCF